MRRFEFLLAWGALLVGASCGPLRAPMATRLDDDVQKRVDEAWDKALSPVGRLDRQRLLDVLVGTEAYQRGVDKLTFRSEKRCAAGRVVMEVHFDRAAPARDRFEVLVLGPDGAELRRETYGREEVEKTYRELFVNVPRPRAGGPGAEPPEAARRRAEHEARWAKILEHFPDPKDNPKQ
jgi:hypothetical protein